MSNKEILWFNDDMVILCFFSPDKITNYFVIFSKYHQASFWIYLLPDIQEVAITMDGKVWSAIFKMRMSLSASTPMMAVYATILPLWRTTILSEPL